MTFVDNFISLKNKNTDCLTTGETICILSIAYRSDLLKYKKDIIV